MVSILPWDLPQPETQSGPHSYSSSNCAEIKAVDLNEHIEELQFHMSHQICVSVKFDKKNSEFDPNK